MEADDNTYLQILYETFFRYVISCNRYGSVRNSRTVLGSRNFIVNCSAICVQKFNTKYCRTNYLFIEIPSLFIYLSSRLFLSAFVCFVIFIFISVLVLHLVSLSLSCTHVNVTHAMFEKVIGLLLSCIGWTTLF